MNIKLRIWRQKNAKTEGKFVDYTLNDVSPDSSFLEMLDQLNEQLIEQNQEPVQFDHDCREGICGSCGMMINGVAHGPAKATATCQLHMRSFGDGDEVWIEPWRGRALPGDKGPCVSRRAPPPVIASGRLHPAVTRGA